MSRTDSSVEPDKPLAEAQACVPAGRPSALARRRPCSGIRETAGRRRIEPLRRSRRKGKAMSEEVKTTWRKYICANRRDEAVGAASYYFYPEDGGELPAYLPGQHVMLRAKLPSGEFGPREYAISQAEGGALIRLTVKHYAGSDEIPSAMKLYRGVQIGTEVELSEPFGDFTFDPKEKHPVVIIGAGIGIVQLLPLLEMLATVNPVRDLHFLYSVQNSAEFALRTDVLSVCKGFHNFGKAIFYTHPLETDVIGRDYDAQGRISPERIRSFCQNPDADFWICGPEDFVEMVKKALLSIGVIAPRLHCEATHAD